MDLSTRPRLRSSCSDPVTLGKSLTQKLRLYWAGCGYGDENLSCGISQKQLSALSASFSCLVSDSSGAFAVWPLAHYLMGKSFVGLVCEMGMIIPPRHGH